MAISAIDAIFPRRRQAAAVRRPTGSLRWLLLPMGLVLSAAVLAADITDPAIGSPASSAFQRPMRADACGDACSA